MHPPHTPQKEQLKLKIASIFLVTIQSSDQWNFTLNFAGDVVWSQLRSFIFWWSTVTVPPQMLCAILRLTATQRISMQQQHHIQRGSRHDWQLLLPPHHWLCTFCEWQFIKVILGLLTKARLCDFLLWHCDRCERNKYHSVWSWHRALDHRWPPLLHNWHPPPCWAIHHGAKDISLSLMGPTASHFLPLQIKLLYHTMQIYLCLPGGWSISGHMLVP